MATMTIGKAVRRNVGGAASDRAGAGDVVEIELGPREVRRLAGDHRGLNIRCVGGLLWVTQAGDCGDYYLGAGEQLTLTKAGPVVVQGMVAPGLVTKG